MAVITTTMDKVLPRHIDVDVFEQAVSHTNWDTININSSEILNGKKQSSGAQNDQIDFSVVLAAGTWDIELMHMKNTARGICSVQLDGVEQGTIDMYGSSTTYNNRTSITGIVVATSAKVTLRLKMTSKNASSSNYFGAVQHIQLRRTSVSDTSAVRIDPDTQMPWLIDLTPFMTPISHVNFDSNTVDTERIYNGSRLSSSAQNDEIDFYVALAPGTYTLELLNTHAANRGIFTVYLDAVSIGTVDPYDSITVRNQLDSITNIVVASVGVYQLKFKMETKNASSSGYYGDLQHIQLRRTA